MLPERGWYGVPTNCSDALGWYRPTEKAYQGGQGGSLHIFETEHSGPGIALRAGKGKIDAILRCP